MTPDQLINAARTLARPCIRLSSIPGTGEPIAWWGAHKARASVDGLDHLLLLDLVGLRADRFGLPPGGSARLFLGRRNVEPGLELDSVPASVDGLTEAERYWDDIWNPFTHAFIGRKYSWRNLDTDVVPLWPYEDESLPWTRDLYRRAPVDVQEGMRGLGWNEDWGFDTNTSGADLVEAYERLYFERLWGADESPLLTLGRDETFAMLGGWPFPMDGESAPEGDLILTAFACSEPQVEVWRVGGEYQLVTRIT